jgi:hypothetical protein
VRAALRIVATAGLPAAAGLALLLLAVPRAPAHDRLAARILGRVQQTPLRGAVLRLEGAKLHASCRRRGYTGLVALDNGTRLAVRGTHVAVRPPSAPIGERALAAERLVAPGGPETPAALADLAGTRALYAKELIGRLATGAPVVEGVSTFRGARAYVVRLGGDRPRVVLYVSVGSLRPLGARYESARLAGTSRLLAGERGGC